MRKRNFFKEKIKAGKSIIGTWCILPSTATINVICSTSIDFIIIDMEHGPISFETAQEMVAIAESENCSPFIRPPDNSEASILRALDIGAHGIVAAHIDSKEAAEKIVSLVKYAPIGERGFSPFTRAGGYSMNAITTHAKNENANTAIVLILEGQAGLDNISDISTVKHIDAIYIGAYDLSQALGFPGQTEHPIVTKEVNRCVSYLQRRGIAAGSYVAKTSSDILKFKNMGMKLITFQVDVTALYHAYEDQITARDNG